MALFAYVALASSFEAAHRPLWYDEVFTARLTQLPSFGEVTRALADAVDTPAPGYYAVQRVAVRLVKSEELGLRLASILSLPIAGLCLYAFAKPDTGALAAAAGAIAILLGPLYHGYSVEARPYAVTVAMLAIAVLSWRRCATSRWGCASLAAALAGATLMNYYAVFALFPFVIAEATRLAVTRRMNAAAWLAIGCGLLPVAVHWPKLAALKTYYAEFYWSKPSVGMTIATYDYLVSTGVRGTGFGLAAVLGVALLVALGLRLKRREFGRPPDLPAVALIIGFLTLPFVAAGVTLVLGGGYSERYAIGVILGFSLGFAYALRFAGDRTILAALACLIGALGAHEVLFWASSGRVGPIYRITLPSHQRVVERVLDTGLPIVIINGVDYVPLAHYASDDVRDRLVTLVNIDASREESGSDSTDLDLLKLRNWWNIRVVDFDQFLAEHREFVVLVTPGASDWWLPRIRGAGFTVDLLVKEGQTLAYGASNKT